MSEAMGWLMVVAGVVLGCSAWIAVGVVRLWSRKTRIYREWAAWERTRRARENKMRGRCVTCARVNDNQDNCICHTCREGSHWQWKVVA